MKRYLFTITLQGYGDTIVKAWADAVNAFIQDPGPVPDDPDFIQEIDDDEDGE